MIFWYRLQSDIVRRCFVGCFCLSFIRTPGTLWVFLVTLGIGYVRSVPNFTTSLVSLYRGLGSTTFSYRSSRLSWHELNAVVVVVVLCFCSLLRQWDAVCVWAVVYRTTVMTVKCVCGRSYQPGYILKFVLDLWWLFLAWNFFHYSTRWSCWNPLGWMDPSLLTAATSKKCHRRQLLLLLLLSFSLSALSLAAKTQIYSQEVAFNCHFLLARGFSPPVRRSAELGELLVGCNGLYYSAPVLGTTKFCNFCRRLPLLLFFRVHNPSWLRVLTAT